MKIVAFILTILSLSKFCIAGSFEKQELAKNLFFQIKDNLDNFQRTIIYILVIDGLIGTLCGLALLL